MTGRHSGRCPGCAPKSGGRKRISTEARQTAGRGCHLDVEKERRPPGQQDCLPHKTRLSIPARADQRQVLVAGDQLTDFREFVGSAGEEAAVDDGAELEGVFQGGHVRGYSLPKTSSKA